MADKTEQSESEHTDECEEDCTEDHGSESSGQFASKPQGRSEAAVADRAVQVSNTDIVSSIDTTGVNPGPHATLEGVTPVFDVDREAQGYDDERDISNADRWAEKALAAGSEQYQADDKAALEEHPEQSAVNSQDTVEDPYPPAGKAIDTSGTDVAASANGREDDDQSDQTDTVDTSATLGQPDSSHVEAATALTEPGAATAVASDPKTDAENPNDVQDTFKSATSEGHVTQRAALNKLKVTDLHKLADKNGITVKPGSEKGQIVDQLVQRGVKAPTD